MDLVFYKLHCVTEDYILINTDSNPECTPDLFPSIASTLCKRRTGIGAYGVVFLKNTAKKITLDLYLLNGEKGSFRSNALMCASRYLFDSGLVGTDSFSLQFFDKTVSMDVIDSAHFRLCLGIAQNPRTGKVLHPQPSADYTWPVQAGGKELAISPVTINNTFFVHMTEEMKKSVLLDLTEEIKKTVKQKLSVYPVFLFIHNRDECVMRFSREGTYGFDFTAACAAGGVAGIMNGLLEREVVVQFKGNTIFFQWLESDNSIYVTAEPHYIFSGNYEFDDSMAGPSS